MFVNRERDTEFVERETVYTYRECVTLERDRRECV